MNIQFFLENSKGPKEVKKFAGRPLAPLENTRSICPAEQSED